MALAAAISSLPGATLGLFASVTGHSELKDSRVMDDTVYSSHGRHRVLEDLLPLGEHQVAGDY